MTHLDYSSVTEAPGTAISREAAEMLVTRYAFAAKFGDGRVVEVACGAGAGLGLLAGRATLTVGGDVTARLLEYARRHYGERVPLLRFDAQALPFSSGSVDCIIMFEAIYYLRDANRFLAEARRVLRAGGTLVLCSVNREWTDFNPSPFSTRYWSAGELSDALAAHGFNSTLYGAFPATVSTAQGVWLSRVKRAAVALNLIPRTMKGTVLLKRLFYGSLLPVPHEIDSSAAPAPMQELDIHTKRPVTGFKVLYVSAVAPEMRS